MTTLKGITKSIRMARRRGSTDYAISKELGVDQREIKRLLTRGYYPGEKVAARIGVPIKCHTCHRRLPKHKQPNQQPTRKKEPTEHEQWWRSLTKEQRENFIKQWHQQAGAY